MEFLRAKQRTGRQPDLCQLCPAELLHRVPCGYVSDLVAHHRRQLRLRGEVHHDPARDVDEPARQGERVHDRIVYDLEAPRQSRPLGTRRQAIAELADVCLYRGIVIQAERDGDLLVGFSAHLNLSAFTDENELALAGGGIHRAGREEQGGHEGQHPSNSVCQAEAFHRLSGVSVQGIG